MRFKVDENLPVEVAELLRQSGHDAQTVLQQHLKGAADSDVASVCLREGRILATLDLDFADIRAYPPAQYPGFIVLRVMRQDKPHVLEIFSRLMRVFGEEPLERRLWIVEDRQIRIRG